MVDTLIQCGDLILEPALLRARFVDGRYAQLTPNEMRMLTVLLDQAGEVVTDMQLVTAAWGAPQAVVTNKAAVYIRRLRRKLEADPACPERIRTVRGVGYCYMPSPGGSAAALRAPDPYAVLWLAPNAPLDVANAAYRALAKRAGDDAAQLQRLNLAIAAIRKVRDARN